MDSYILDTNLFFNMEEGMDLGDKTEEVIRNMTKAIKKLKELEQGIFYMPPLIVEEMLSFFENKEQDFLKEYLNAIVIKSPSVDDKHFPARFFYQLVEDVRERSYRGLRVGEEEIIKAGRMMQGKGDLSKKDFEIAIGDVTRKYRERYRQATRTGFLDSVADLDLIVLAKEVDGYLISTDEGVIAWGRTFGVKEMPASVFGARLKPLISAT